MANGKESLGEDTTENVERVLVGGETPKVYGFVLPDLSRLAFLFLRQKRVKTIRIIKNTPSAAPTAAVTAEERPRLETSVSTNATDLLQHTHCEVGGEEVVGIITFPELLLLNVVLPEDKVAKTVSILADVVESPIVEVVELGEEVTVIVEVDPAIA